MLSSTTHLRDRLEKNTNYFRSKMSKVGFDILDGVHPIVPIMLYDSLWLKGWQKKCSNKESM